MGRIKCRRKSTAVAISVGKDLVRQDSSIVDGFDQPIRFGRYHGEGSVRVPRFRLPRLVKSCNPEQPTVCDVSRAARNYFFGPRHS
jgi:hypothetical protein